VGTEICPTVNKLQITSTKLQMVRQAHHPEQRRRVNLKFQYPIFKTSLNFQGSAAIEAWKLRLTEYSFGIETESLNVVTIQSRLRFRI
jgi:hypothetical protein